MTHRGTRIDTEAGGPQRDTEKLIGTHRDKYRGTHTRRDSERQRDTDRRERHRGRSTGSDTEIY